jgi:small-conductance mechanosensitive channel
LILIQRPYGIGDRINVSNSESEASYGGAQGWIVDDVTLFTTTVYLAGTNERATISNGTLAKSRIVNGSRSPKAICTVTMKFGVDTPFKKIEVFKNAIEKFVKARPREWFALVAIRAGRVEADLGFIEYGIVLQHREGWQNIGPILDSKQTVACFGLELTKKLNIRYSSPPLPVDVNMGGQRMPQFQISYDLEGITDEGNERRSSEPPRSVDHSDYDDVASVVAMFDKK